MTKLTERWNFILRNKRKLRSMYELSLCKLVYDYCCMVDIETSLFDIDISHNTIKMTNWVIDRYCVVCVYSVLMKNWHEIYNCVSGRWCLWMFPCVPTIAYTLPFHDGRKVGKFYVTVWIHQLSLVIGFLVWGEFTSFSCLVFFKVCCTCYLNLSWVSFGVEILHILIHAFYMFNFEGLQIF